MSLFRVKRFFTFKDKLLKMLLLGLAYKCKSGGCNTTYYGKTIHHFQVRICKYLGISQLTGKKVKIEKQRSKNTSYVVTTLHTLKTFPF